MTQERTGRRDAVLEFVSAEKVYQSGSVAVRALQSTSFAIGPAELVAIMGPSGSGKSTMLSLAGALDNPTSGSVFILGRNLAMLGPNEVSQLRRRTIGYVFQEFNLLPGLTALENAALPLELDGVPARHARAQAMEALRGVEIAALADRFPDNLSGGEQQRVAIARAFVGSRQLLLADEPTGALDSTTGEVVMQLLRRQCDEGRSGLLVTHNASHAAWADRVIFIKDGEITDQSVVSSETVPINTDSAVEKPLP